MKKICMKVHELMDEKSYQRLIKVCGLPTRLFEKLKSTDDVIVLEILICLFSQAETVDKQLCVAEIMMKFLISNQCMLRNYPKFYSATYKKLQNNFSSDNKKVISVSQKYHFKIFGSLKQQCIRVLIKNDSLHKINIPDLSWICRGETFVHLPVVFESSSLLTTPEILTSED